MSVELSPLHALIGPNDSGKSTLLNAIYTAGQLATGSPIADLSHAGCISDSKDVITLQVQGAGASCVFAGTSSELYLTLDPPTERAPKQTISAATGRGYPPHPSLGLNGVRLLRLDPDALRQPSPLMRLDEPSSFFDLRGQGLAGLLSAIYLRGEEEPIARIRTKIQELFPAVQRVGPTSTGANKVVLEAVLMDGTRVRATELSAGLLYYLAFLILEYLQSVSILLIEEPENGLHPSRIGDVVRVLRHLTETQAMQVILATHSPLAINELKPGEVSVVTRADPNVGTVIRPLTQTPNFEARSKVLNLGELWLSYANGKDEAPLFEEPEGLKSRKIG